MILKHRIIVTRKLFQSIIIKENNKFNNNVNNVQQIIVQRQVRFLIMFFTTLQTITVTKITRKL